MKLKKFALAVSSSFPNLIYHGAVMDVHLLLLKFTMNSCYNKLYLMFQKKLTRLVYLSLNVSFKISFFFVFTLSLSF